MYQQFHGRHPAKIKRLRASRHIPPVLVELGELRGVIYRSDKWTPGVKRNYIHFMDQAPLLVSNPEGTQMYILGGNYRVTHKGIEG